MYNAREKKWAMNTTLWLENLKGIDICAVAYLVGGGGLRGSTPLQIPKSLQNRTKLNPIVKTVKNCWI